MLALLFTFALFLYWSLIGFATLTVFPPRLRIIQGILIAPAVGVAVTILPVFLLNRAGFPVQEFGGILISILLTLALLIILIKRPSFPVRRVLPFISILVLALILVAWPMIKYGFDWVSFSNDDMANYCLGAQRFLNHGYFELPNGLVFSGLDYSQDYWGMHVADGSRSGSELLLAVVWAATNLNAHQLFMPVILSLNLALYCSAGALVASRHFYKKAPLITVSLMAISPLTTLGALYQLIGQVGGLTLLCTAIVLFFRRSKLRTLKRLVISNFLAAIVFSSMFIWYPEGLPFLGIGWFIFLGLQIGQSRKNAKYIIVPSLLIGVISLLFLGSYLLTAIQMMISQSSTGMGHPSFTLFPYYLIPSGVPALFGMLSIVSVMSEPFLSMLIAFGFFLLFWFIILVISQLRKIYLAAIISALMMVLSAVLFYRHSDFGLFKLAMYIQPFLVAVIATRISEWQLPINYISYFKWGLVFIVIFFSITTQRSYVIKSTGEVLGGLVEVPFASSEKINNQFNLLMNALPDKNKYFISDTSNVVQAKFQALYTQASRLYFVSNNFFTFVINGTTNISKLKLANRGNYSDFIRQYKQQNAEQYRSETIKMGGSENAFKVLSMLKETNSTNILIGSRVKQTIFNLSLNDQIKNATYYRLISHPENYLIFISSKMGPPYYTTDRDKVAFYQIEQDPLFPGQYISGLGQYALFMVKGCTKQPRMVIEMSATVLKQFDSVLPTPSIIGSKTTILPFVGRGGGRMFSAPLAPAKIGGAEYFGLDFGRAGRLFPRNIKGFMKLYGTDITLDSRKLTVFGRDISLISEEGYKAIKPPSQVANFPADLANKSLEYSGVYEDGWISERSFFALEAGKGTTFLRLKGIVPLIDDPKFSTTLTVTIGGKIAVRKILNIGAFELNIPVTGVQGRQRIDLVFEKYQRLPGDDGRITPGKIEFIGFLGNAGDKKDEY